MRKPIAIAARKPTRRFERLNVLLTILFAGWVPSVLMLVVSYTILSATLESRILGDRQTFISLIAHMVGDDLMRTSGIIEYYQTLPAVAKVLTDRTTPGEAQQWLMTSYYSHPRVDGMFLTTADGRMIAALPYNEEMIGQDFASAAWLGPASASNAVYVSPVHPRLPDHRMATEIIGPVRAADGHVLGYIGASVLVERIGRRLSAIQFSDESSCQILDQTGAALFTRDFQPNPGATSPAAVSLIQEIRRLKTGHLDRHDNLYSFSLIDSTGWTAVVEQPKIVAYKPVHDLLTKMTALAGWLIAGTAVFAWLAGKFYRRQAETAERMAREVIFNENILANMPSGIALVDPETHRFLQANEAFTRMARRLGKLPDAMPIAEASYTDVGIAPDEAIAGVLATGEAFQLVEQRTEDKAGAVRFVNISLLRLQDAQGTVQGVLYLVVDKTRDVELRQELIAANAAKDQFLALLSHELRNPLSPVIAMVAEVEARTPENASEVHDALEVIRRNVELEARLIDDLLDVTRIAKGKLQLSPEPVSVHEILHRAYEISRGEILAKRLGVEFRLRAARCWVEGDPARLQQVFWNLIKNSVKFTPADGRIIIETYNPEPDRLEIKITDTGIGIEAEKIGKIFNAFEQGQSSITRRFGGLGLGLAISKAMMEAHGGKLTAESAGTDQGATFTAELAVIDEPVRGDAASKKSGARKGASSSQLPAAPGANGQARVLVVDDHEDTCMGMKMLLERRGYHITLAHSAAQAAEKAREEKFDLMISDIGLPDRTGFELMVELRDRHGLRGIALSGFGMENDVARARAAGFSEHLTKPINFERLEEAMRSLLESAPKS